MANKKEATGNVAFQVRLDAETHSQLKQAAEEADLSLNQLVTGLLRGCAAHLVVGEAGRDDKNVVYPRSTPKCVFVGKKGSYPSREETEWLRTMEGEDPMPYPGEVWFGLDYSGRGFVPGK